MNHKHVGYRASDYSAIIQWKANVKNPIGYSLRELV